MSYDILFLASDLLGGLGDLTAGFLGLGHRLDNTDSNGLEIGVSRRMKAPCGWIHTCLMSRTAKRPRGG